MHCIIGVNSILVKISVYQICVSNTGFERLGMDLSGIQARLTKKSNRRDAYFYFIHTFDIFYGSQVFKDIKFFNISKKSVFYYTAHASINFHV